MPFFPLFSAIYGALGPELLGAAAKKTSSGGSFIFILLIVVLGAYLLFGRRRRRMQTGQQQQIAVGDEIVTTSGIIGRVEFIGDDRAHISIAPDTTIEVLRAAIARRLDPIVPPSEEVAGYGAPAYGEDEPVQGDEHESDVPDDPEPEGSA